jgi:DNA-binding CsgD family transcriptional regulator
MVAVQSSAVRRCLDKLDMLVTARVGLFEYAGEARLAIRRAIGFDGWCLCMADPVSRLPNGTVLHDAPLSDKIAPFWRFEFAQDSAIPRRTAQSAAARTDPAGALRLNELLLPGGVADELRIPLLADGVYWGGLGVFRSAGGRPFSEDEVAAAAEIMPALAAGARSTWASSASAAPSRPSQPSQPERPLPPAEPGTLLLTADGRVVSQTPQGQAWLGALGYSPARGTLAAVVAMLETRATASLRTRGPGGLWVLLSGGRLDPPVGPAAIAITIQPASPAEVTPLLLRAYGLTPRQRLVTRLLLAGRSTQQLATALRVSPYTVNDHVKAIQAKVGVHSRTELAAVLTGIPAVSGARGAAVPGRVAH